MVVVMLWHVVMLFTFRKCLQKVNNITTITYNNNFVNDITNDAIF